eukprot:CAMPEP_0170615588 /NCGR_PEP_ID=MMETSP0224-20130122/25419_1 /TAXON_ID=285029 /ORGANISM="Togula jolla, Strain CCCM 725" /LENGTH=531 /DNA_ID=CAMNT_0010941333 /DNA_START=176 /DNA_END=1768 /DNA_ORIENTATION=-
MDFPELKAVDLKSAEAKQMHTAVRLVAEGQGPVHDFFGCRASWFKSKSDLVEEKKYCIAPDNSGDVDGRLVRAKGWGSGQIKPPCCHPDYPFQPDMDDTAVLENYNTILREAFVPGGQAARETSRSMREEFPLKTLEGKSNKLVSDFAKLDSQLEEHAQRMTKKLAQMSQQHKDAEELLYSKLCSKDKTEAQQARVSVLHAAMDVDDQVSRSGIALGKLFWYSNSLRPKQVLDKFYDWPSLRSWENPQALEESVEIAKRETQRLDVHMDGASDGDIYSIQTFKHLVCAGHLGGLSTGEMHLSVWQASLSLELLATESGLPRVRLTDLLGPEAIHAIFVGMRSAIWKARQAEIALGQMDVAVDLKPEGILSLANLADNGNKMALQSLIALMKHENWSVRHIAATQMCNLVPKYGIQALGHILGKCLLNRSELPEIKAACRAQLVPNMLALAEVETEMGRVHFTLQMQEQLVLQGLPLTKYEDRLMKDLLAEVGRNVAPPSQEQRWVGKPRQKPIVLNIQPARSDPLRAHRKE